LLGRTSRRPHVHRAPRPICGRFCSVEQDHAGVLQYGGAAPPRSPNDVMTVKDLGAIIRGLAPTSPTRPIGIEGLACILIDPKRRMCAPLKTMVRKMCAE